MTEIFKDKMIMLSLIVMFIFLAVWLHMTGGNDVLVVWAQHAIDGVIGALLLSMKGSGGGNITGTNSVIATDSSTADQKDDDKK